MMPAPPATAGRRIALLDLKTKKELAAEALTLSRSFEMVRHLSNLYIPADFETLESDPVPPVERCMWVLLDRQDIQRRAASQFNTLFSNEGELSSFTFMMAQASRQVDATATTLLVRTTEGLKELQGSAELGDPRGVFVPNTLVPMLNTDQVEKDRVFAVIADWLDSEEEAHSLLSHVATALAPGWSAVKYVLLLGEGRNGKSLFMKMVQGVFGARNTSSVTRQHMAEQSPVVTELNGKLLNIVFDGAAEYLKDSGVEKSLIAGEPAPIRKLYESTPTVVQTRALFIEGLNGEPKSRDKSSALMKRITRFQFPNVYGLDLKFEKKMLSEDSLGAFLALLIDHYVKEDEVAERLAPTTRSIELQLEHMFSNSIGLQYLKYLAHHSVMGVDGLIGTSIEQLTSEFQSWRLKENDISAWPEPDVMNLFKAIVNTERRSVRVNGEPRKSRIVTSFKPESVAFIKSLKGAEEHADADILDSVVDS